MAQSAPTRTDCPPAACFFTSWRQVPAGRLLTEQSAYFPDGLEVAFQILIPRLRAPGGVHLCRLRGVSLITRLWRPHKSGVFKLCVTNFEYFYTSHVNPMCFFTLSSTVSFLPTPMMEQLQFPQTSSPCISQQHPGQQYAGTLSLRSQPTDQSEVAIWNAQWSTVGSRSAMRIFTFSGINCSGDSSSLPALWHSLFSSSFSVNNCRMDSSVATTCAS